MYSLQFISWFLSKTIKLKIRENHPNFLKNYISLWEESINSRSSFLVHILCWRQFRNREQNLTQERLNKYVDEIKCKAALSNNGMHILMLSFHFCFIRPRWCSFSAYLVERQEQDVHKLTGLQ